MRIGLFTDTYKPDANGCAQSVEVLANNLIKLGHEVFIFCPGNNLLIEKEENIIKIPGIEVKKFYGYKIAQPIHPLIQKEVDDLHLDIIHAETEFGVGTLANIVAFNLNIPRVRTYHTDYVDYTHYFVPEELGPIYDGAKRIVTLYNKFYGDHCLRLMTPSEKTKKGLLKAGIKTKIDVVPNGIELDRFNISNTSTNDIKSIKDKYQIKNDDKLFVYVGRLADEKRVDFLINVFNKVKSKNIKAKLLIVGLGPSENKLKQIVSDNKLEDYVKFTGKVEPKDVPMYYHAADCFVSASTSETQGLTYIEALASNLPVIVAYDEVLDGLVKEGENGYFFNDEEECFNAICAFTNLSNNDLEKIKLNALNSSKIYDAKKFALDTIKIYEEVIEEYKHSYQVIKTRLSNDIVKLVIKNRMGDEIKLNLSVDDYYNHGFRKDSLISLKIANELKENESVVLAYRNALRKLSMKDYSTKQMKDSLLRKYELSEYQLYTVMNKLNELGLLNDRKYTISRISVLKDSLMSKKAIFNKLIKEGISKEIIDELYVGDDENELLKCRKKALKYQILIKGKSINHKKQTILTKLVTDGFELEMVKSVINELDFSKEILVEDELLKIQTEKAYNKYRTKYEGYELRNHIFNYLASKGFNLEAIYTVINEMEY